MSLKRLDFGHKSSRFCDDPWSLIVNPNFDPWSLILDQRDNFDPLTLIQLSTPFSFNHLTLIKFELWSPRFVDPDLRSAFTTSACRYRSVITAHGLPLYGHIEASHFKRIFNHQFWSYNFRFWCKSHLFFLKDFKSEKRTKPFRVWSNRISELKLLKMQATSHGGEATDPLPGKTSASLLSSPSGDKLL